MSDVDPAAWGFDDAKLKMSEIQDEIPDECDAELEFREVGDLQYQFELTVYGYHLKEPVLKALHRALGAFTARWEGQPDESEQYHVWLIKND